MMGLLAFGSGVADQFNKNVAEESAFQRNLQMMREKIKLDSDQRRSDDEYAWNKKLERAPEEQRMASERAKATEMAKLDPDVVSAQRGKKEGDAQADLDFASRTLNDRIKILRAEANAKQDPTARAAAAANLKQAELKLAELEEESGSRRKVRGLLSAADSVDMSMPGGETSRKFYEDEALRMTKNNRMLKGDTGETNRNRYSATKILDEDGNEVPGSLDQKTGEASPLKMKKTFPVGKLAEYAKKRGVSEQEAKAALEAAGWKVM